MSEGKKICITTDCACDLPSEWLKENEVDVLYFYITTETGRFRDVDEITAQNIFEYMNNNGLRTQSKAPNAEEFQSYFTEKLRTCDELIHIVISEKISMSGPNAKEAVRRMGDEGKRVHIFDSEHLSTGLGHMVIHAVSLRDAGCGVPEILAGLAHIRGRVSTSFIANSAEYLYRNGKIGKNVMQLCSAFRIHPVFRMKNGRISLRSVEIGNYERSMQRYVKKTLKDPQSIMTDRVFITHAGCSHSDVELVRAAVQKYAAFESIQVTRASATISSNCGPRSVGVLFVRK